MQPFEANKSESTNLPLPDRLEKVRREIKIMKAREAEIVLALKESGGEKGAFWEAVIQETSPKRLDMAAVKATYGDELERFYTQKNQVSVKLKYIGDDE